MPHAYLRSGHLCNSNGWFTVTPRSPTATNLEPGIMGMLSSFIQYGVPIVYIDSMEVCSILLNASPQANISLQEFVISLDRVQYSIRHGRARRMLGVS